MSKHAATPEEQERAAQQAADDFDALFTESAERGEAKREADPQGYMWGA